MRNNTTDELTYTRRVWIKGGIYSLIVVLLLLFKATFGVLLLILAGVLIAVFFRGLSGLVRSYSGWKEGVCLTISVVFTLSLLIGIIWLIGAKLENQITELNDKFPAMLGNAKAKISEYPIGEKIIDKLSSPSSMKKAQGLTGAFFKSTFGVAGDIYVILFLGIFFTVSPLTYRNGLVAIIPEKGKEKGKEVLSILAVNLKKWLKGKIFSMFVVMVLTAIGLAVVGVPLWLVLAIIAGLLNFIPNFGPLIAMIPAILVAFMQGANTAIIVAGLYIFIQVLESNFITPAVQKKLVNIPPALIIAAQLLIGPLTGGWGLVLATPLMLILLVLVKELYIKKQ